MIRFEPVSTQNRAFVEAIQRHYAQSAGAPPGKKMGWAIWDAAADAAERDPMTFRGWIGLGEPAFKLAPRRALGIENALSLPRTVSCFIYRLEAPGHEKASAILRAWHDVAALAWSDEYGWEPEHWETMIGVTGEVTSEVPGACFRRAQYRALGLTTGRSRRRPAGHSGHKGRCSAIWVDADPKLVLYRGPLPRLPGQHSYTLPERRFHPPRTIFADGQESLL